jgi:hypothetical protein
MDLIWACCPRTVPVDRFLGVKIVLLIFSKKKREKISKINNRKEDEKKN